MFDVRTLQQDPGEIPFANWLQGFVGRRGQDIVKGTGLPLGSTPAIGMTGVINHLVLMTGAFGAFFDDEVLDAVVAGGLMRHSQVRSKSPNFLTVMMSPPRILLTFLRTPSWTCQPAPGAACLP